eukprot:TRINITY_DN92007_c0_g1_i1.p1 TRINITY_DN92007_c0_g1~~TRINITY_DN92007_c0_g1_i1.p1  ORF type:complete len:431 (+),score=58.41 TRINITY_DN92007_c0_g1_i1:39-1331(+)
MTASEASAPQMADQASNGAASSKEGAASSPLTGKRFAVTGGCGFLGQAIVSDLLHRGAALVRIVDVSVNRAAALCESDSRVEAVVADVTDFCAVVEALRGMDCVMHTASYFGRPSFSSSYWCSDSEHVRKVNVDGTKNVISACYSEGVKALVFTSSANVIFTGKVALEGADESAPYPRLGDYVDDYGPAKAEAERAVLAAANSSKDQGALELRTCALRPNGIWGPSRACISFMRALQMHGMFGGCYAAVGTNIFTDYSHVDNVAQAHALAAARLLRDDDPDVNGQAFFITDDEKVNVLEVHRACVEACGWTWWPVLPVPAFLITALAYFSEIFCAVLRCLFYGGDRISPPVTYPEALKVTVTHYFSSAKARQVLGYEPRGSVETMPEVAAFFAKEFKSVQAKALYAQPALHAFAVCFVSVVAGAWLLSIG